MLTLVGLAFGPEAASQDLATPPTLSPRDQVIARLGAARPFLRGMTVSCPTNGREWGSPLMTEALREIRPLGVEWVSIHPYAWVGRNGEIRAQRAADLPYLADAVARTRAEKLELFWVPHLAYWGSFEWRGAIDFGDDAAAWRRFFDGYREFIVDQAAFAERQGVKMLAVGLEYEQTTTLHEAEWRRILTEVRAVYHGVVVYSANWDRLDAVPFWDAVDVIGVQAYFPLADRPYPDRAAIERGWAEPLERLAALSRRYRKPALFNEIGYDLSDKAATEPWLPSTRESAENRALRRRLMEVALARLEREPYLLGMFWWKWLPARPAHDPDFNMEDPDARALLREYWAR